MEGTFLVSIDIHFLKTASFVLDCDFNLPSTHDLMQAISQIIVPTLIFELCVDCSVVYHCAIIWLRVMMQQLLCRMLQSCFLI